VKEIKIEKTLQIDMTKHAKLFYYIFLGLINFPVFIITLLVTHSLSSAFVALIIVNFVSAASAITIPLAMALGGILMTSIAAPGEVEFDWESDWNKDDEN